MTEVKKQAVAPKTKKFGEEAFEISDNTVIRWLGNAGVMINSRGTCIMIDPLLKGFDMNLLIDIPINIEDVPNLDGILITHCDNDHFSRVTCRELSYVCKSYHGPNYVAKLMEKEGLESIGHNIDDSFYIGDVKITLTPADHAWQNESTKYSKIRKFNFEDYCGFWLETKDGTIWTPGDSRLLDEHLNMKKPDVIIFDFSNNSWHIGLNDAIKLANVYPEAKLILSHWGSVDAPGMDAFNADPESLKGRVVNEERIYIMAPGEEFLLGEK